MYLGRLTDSILCHDDHEVLAASPVVSTAEPISARLAPVTSAAFGGIRRACSTLAERTRPRTEVVTVEKVVEVPVPVQAEDSSFFDDASIEAFLDTETAADRSEDVVA